MPQYTYTDLPIPDRKVISAIIFATTPVNDFSLWLPTISTMMWLHNLKWINLGRFHFLISALCEYHSMKVPTMQECARALITCAAKSKLDLERRQGAIFKIIPIDPYETDAKTAFVISHLQGTLRPFGRQSVQSEERYCLQICKDVAVQFRAQENLENLACLDDNDLTLPLQIPKTKQPLGMSQDEFLLARASDMRAVPAAAAKVTKKEHTAPPVKNGASVKEHVKKEEIEPAKPTKVEFDDKIIAPPVYAELDSKGNIMLVSPLDAKYDMASVAKRSEIACANGSAKLI